MKNIVYIILSFLITIAVACNPNKKSEESTVSIESVSDTITYPGEKYFKSLTMLTYGGDNAEAYWSFDDSKLIFQVTNPKWENDCDQIYYFNWQKDDIINNRP